MDNLRTLYDTLLKDGYDVPQEYGRFSGKLLKDEKSRESLYGLLKKDNYDVPGDYGSFSAALFGDGEPGPVTTGGGENGDAVSLRHAGNGGAGAGTTGVPVVPAVTFGNNKAAILKGAEYKPTDNPLAFKPKTFAQRNRELIPPQLYESDEIEKAVAAIFEEEKYKAEKRAEAEQENFGNSAPFVPSLAAGIRRGAIDARNTDPESVMRKVYDRLEPRLTGLIESHIARLAPAGDAEEKAVREQAEGEMRDYISSLVAGKYIEEKTPRTAAGYIAGSAAKDNVLSMLGSALVRKAAGSSAAAGQIEDEAYGRYGEKAGVAERIGAGVATLVADTPAFAFTGMLGSAAGKGVVQLAGKPLPREGLTSFARGVAAGAGKRSFTSSLGGRIVTGAVNSGVTLGGYDMVTETARQLRCGEYGTGQIASAAGKGFALGALTAPIGITGRYLTRASGKAAKIAADTGAFGLESGVFALPAVYGKTANGGHIGLDELGEEFAVSAGTLAMLKVKNAGRLGREIRSRYSASEPGSMKLTALDREILSRKGYGIGDLFKTEKLDNTEYYTVRGQEVKASEPAAPSEKVLAATEVLTVYEKAMRDAEIPLALKARLAYLIEGRVTGGIPAVYGSAIEERNGRHFVTSVDAAGRPIEIREYKAKEKAGEAFEKLQDISERNSIEATENICNEYARKTALGKACMELPNSAGVYSEYMRVSRKEEKSRTPREQALYTDISTRADKYYDSQAAPEEIKARVGKSTGVDMDKAIVTPLKKRTVKQQWAVEKYMTELRSKFLRREKPEDRGVRLEAKLLNGNDVTIVSGEPETDAHGKVADSKGRIYVKDHTGKVSVVDAKEISYVTETPVATIEDMINVYGYNKEEAEYARSVPDYFYKKELDELNKDLSRSISYSQGGGGRPRHFGYWKDKFNLPDPAGLKEQDNPAAGELTQDETRHEDFMSSLPRTKDGNMDFDSFTPAQVFEYTRRREGEETAVSDAHDMLNNTDRQIKELEIEIPKAIGGKRVALRENLNRLRLQRDEIVSLLPRSEPEEPMITESQSLMGARKPVDRSDSTAEEQLISGEANATIDDEPNNISARFEEKKSELNAANERIGDSFEKNNQTSLFGQDQTPESLLDVPRDFSRTPVNSIIGPLKGETDSLNDQADELKETREKKVSDSPGKFSSRKRISGDSPEPSDKASVPEPPENKDVLLGNNRGEISGKDGNILNLPQENKEADEYKYQEGLQVSDRREDHGGNGTAVLRGGNSGVHGIIKSEPGEGDRGNGRIRLRGGKEPDGSRSEPTRFGSGNLDLELNNESTDSLLDRYRIKHTSQRVFPATPESFYEAISSGHLENPNGWMVSVHDTDYYQKAKLFLTEDGKSGIAVSPDGDIVSLFSSVGGDSRMEKLMLVALANGGKKLDCFDRSVLYQNAKGLPDIYSRYGFEAVSTVPFDTEFAPEGWTENAGELPIIFMVHNGKPVEDVLKGYDRMSRADMTGLKDFEDYGEAMNYRDAVLESRNRAGSATTQAHPETVEHKINPGGGGDIRFQGNENKDLPDNKNIESRLEKLEHLFGVPVERTYISEINNPAIKERAKRGAKAWYDINTGKVNIIADNIINADDAALSYIHEVVGHKGLRDMLGEELYRELMQSVYSGMDAPARIKYNSRYGNPQKAAEEYIADICEGMFDRHNRISGKLRNAWNRIVGIFRNFFRKLYNLKITDTDIEYLLWQSAHHLRGNKGNILYRAQNSVLRHESETARNYRGNLSEQELIERDNARFNEELQQQIDGTLPKWHVYKLGYPGDILKSAGIPDLPIELSASRFLSKSKQENHPFDLSEIKDLPLFIQNPLAVFRSATHIGSFVILTQIEHNGKNFVIAIEANQSRGNIEVNSIRSIHYRRSNVHIANWIVEGLLEYVDKKRMTEWFSKQRYNSADVRKTFSHAANIISNFENPKIEDNNLRFREEKEDSPGEPGLSRSQAERRPGTVVSSNSGYTPETSDLTLEEWHVVDEANAKPDDEPNDISARLEEKKSELNAAKKRISDTFKKDNQPSLSGQEQTPESLFDVPRDFSRTPANSFIGPLKRETDSLNARADELKESREKRVKDSLKNFSSRKRISDEATEPSDDISVPEPPENKGEPLGNKRGEISGKDGNILNLPQENKEADDYEYEEGLYSQGGEDHGGNDTAVLRGDDTVIHGIVKSEPGEGDRGNGRIRLRGDFQNAGKGDYGGKPGKGNLDLELNNESIDLLLDYYQIKHTSQRVLPATPESFYNAISSQHLENPDGWMVSVHGIDYYNTAKLFLTEDGKSGIAISPDGDIVSLFSSVGGDSRMEKLMLFALANGGKKLDCFDKGEFIKGRKGLPDLYSRYGFEAVSTVPFDKEFAPEGWNGREYPPIIFMVHNGKSVEDVLKGYDRMSRADRTGLKDFEDYWEAMNYRDAVLESRNRAGSATIPVDPETVEHEINPGGGADIRLSGEDDYLTAEEAAIKAKSKQNGTYLKAPNGEPTNLTERQWLQVRTKAFRDWFGDWEKSARIEKLRRSKPIEITGNEIEPGEDLKQYRKNALKYGKGLQGYYVNKDTGTTIHLQRGRRNGGINEVLQHDYKDIEHLQSIAAIPQIIESSIYVDSRENTDKSKNPSVVEYQYYCCGLKIADADFTVKSVIALDKDGNRYYDHKLTRLEKTKLLDQINEQAVDIDGFGTTPSTKLTTNRLNKDKRLLSLLQTNSSKVSDSNGEPLVVYHVTNPDEKTRKRNVITNTYDTTHNQFFVFKKSNKEHRGHFSLLDTDNAEAYGNTVYGVMLNIRHPLVIDAKGLSNVSIEHGGERRDDSEWAAYAGRNGFDGVIFYNIREGFDMGDMQYPVTEYIAFYPHQIKSAADNSGGPSVFNGDTRFQGNENKDLPDNKNIESRLEKLEHLFGVPLERTYISEINNPTIKERAKRGAKAWYDINTGKVNIITDNIINADDVALSYIHEVVGHKGLRDMLGEELYRELMQLVYSGMDAPARIKYNSRYGNPQKAAEEYIADICEEMFDRHNRLSGKLRNAWNRIVGIFRNFFRKLYNLKITDTDIEYLLWQSAQHLRGNKGNILYRAQNSVLRHESETARNYRGNLSEKELIERDNARFNEELQQQIDGTLPKWHVYKLGYPGNILKSAGIPDLPIEMAASTLSLKSSRDYKSNHPYDLSDIENLVEAIQYPIAVFESEELNGKKVILTELKDKKGKDFIAIIDLKSKKGRDVINVNDVISLYPKDSVKHIAEWFDSTNPRGLNMKEDLLLWVDAKKASQWLSNYSSHVNRVGLSSRRITNKIRNFGNSKSDDNNLRFREGKEDSTGGLGLSRSQAERRPGTVVSSNSGYTPETSDLTLEEWHVVDEANAKPDDEPNDISARFEEKKSELNAAKKRISDTFKKDNQPSLSGQEQTPESLFDVPRDFSRTPVNSIIGPLNRETDSLNARADELKESREKRVKDSLKNFSSRKRISDEATEPSDDISVPEPPENKDVPLGNKRGEISGKDGNILNLPQENKAADDYEYQEGLQVSDRREDHGGNDTAVLRGDDTGVYGNGARKPGESDRGDGRIRLRGNKEYDGDRDKSNDSGSNNSDIWINNESVDSLLDSYQVKHTSQKVLQATAESFYEAISSQHLDNPNGWMVSVHDVDYYRTAKLFLTEDRNSGIAVSPDGDIVSLFSSVTGDTRMEKLMLVALANGGCKLDCFDQSYVTKNIKGLPDLYSRYGFEAVSTVPFDTEFAPEGWTENAGELPIIFMVHNGKPVEDVLKGYDRMSRADRTGLKDFEDYGEAMNYRDSVLESRNRAGSATIQAHPETVKHEINPGGGADIRFQGNENKDLPDNKNIESRLEKLEHLFGVPLERIYISEINNPTIKERAKRGAKAWYDINTGKVNIIADNIINADDAALSYIHEVVGHKGLRDMLGEELYRDLMQSVYSGMDAPSRIKYNSRYGNPQKAAEEYIADICEGMFDRHNRISGKLRNAWNRIVGIFRNFFRKLYNLKITDTDIEYLLWQSAHHLRGNKGNILYRAQNSVLRHESETARNYRGNLSEKELIERDNARFNEELQQQIDGTLPKWHVYKLGYPGNILKSAGIPDLPIELSSTTLKKKSSAGYVNKHPFEFSEVFGLVKAIQNPIAVFDSTRFADSKVILTELKHNGTNFVAAVRINTYDKTRKIDINSITSLYPKDRIQGVLDWINSGTLMKWVDKEKALEWLTQQRTFIADLDNRKESLNAVSEWLTQQRYNSADVESPTKNLDVATKIIERFENPKTGDNNLRFREEKEDSAGEPGLSRSQAERRPGTGILSDQGYMPETLSHYMGEETCRRYRIKEVNAGKYIDIHKRNTTAVYKAVSAYIKKHPEEFTDYSETISGGTTSKYIKFRHHRVSYAIRFSNHTKTGTETSAASDPAKGIVLTLSPADAAVTDVKIDLSHIPLTGNQIKNILSEVVRYNADASNRFDIDAARDSAVSSYREGRPYTPRRIDISNYPYIGAAIENYFVLNTPTVPDTDKLAELRRTERKLMKKMHGIYNFGGYEVNVSWRGEIKSVGYPGVDAASLSLTEKAAYETACREAARQASEQLRPLKEKYLQVVESIKKEMARRSVYAAAVRVPFYRVDGGTDDGKSLPAKYSPQVAARLSELGQEFGVSVEYTPVAAITDREIREKAGRGAKAWYDIATGKVTVIADNTTDADDATLSYVHEVIAHKGLREMLGNERHSALMQAIYDSMDADSRKEYGSRYGSPHVAAEEYTADICEVMFHRQSTVTGRLRNAWNRIIGAVRNFFRKFFSIEMSKTDIEYLLGQSAQYLRNNNRSILYHARNSVLKHEAEAARNYRGSVPGKETTGREGTRLH